MREWEIWNPNFVETLAGNWGDPKKQSKGNTSLTIHWQLIEKAASLIEGNSVLDVGCGLGHLYAVLGKNIDYLGVDSSEPMIVKTYNFFPDEKNRFIVGDAYNLSSFPMFDTIMAVGLLLHLPDPEPVIRQMWSKANICIVFSVWLGECQSKKITGKKKYLIQRRDTKTGLNEIFKRLDGCGKIEDYPFNNHIPGQSNHFFKLWKKNTC